MMGYLFRQSLLLVRRVFSMPYPVFFLFRTQDRKDILASLQSRPELQSVGVPAFLASWLDLICNVEISPSVNTAGDWL